MPAPPVVVRPRRPDDVRRLVSVLAEQQPVSGYPLRWPQPRGPEAFVVREGQEAAWVAEVGGEVVGHVAVGPVPAGEEADAFTAALGTDRLGLVTVLFVAADAVGRGIGGRLLDTAVAHLRPDRRVPVLDVVPTHDRALAVYRHRGWVEVGRLRPPWLLADAPDVLLMALREGAGARSP